MTLKIIEKIEKYMSTAKPEINSFGEVYTCIEMVREIIDIFPKNIWSNQNLKILDPANGMGNFPSIIVEKLI